MLIPYSALSQLPSDTVDNLIREYLLRQVEDGSFDAMSDDALTAAITKCRQSLAKGELVVEYSEDDESVAIRRCEDVVYTDPNDE